MGFSKPLVWTIAGRFQRRQIVLSGDLILVLTVVAIPLYLLAISTGTSISNECCGQEMKRNSVRNIIALVISLVALAVYLPALRNGFVNWDDPHYVFLNTHIRSLSPDFFRWALFDASTVYWHPLTWISHAMDYAVWGLNPFGHHLTSIVLHALNTFVVVCLTIRLFGILRQAGSSFFQNERAVLIAGGVVGALFGLHPVHVESVAWVAERKDLLYSLFYLLSIMTYAGFVRNLQESGSPESWYRSRRYYFTLALFLLSLCAKPMAVTLPAVLLLLDWYLFGRLASGNKAAAVLLEKVPFLALSVIVSIVTVLAQKKVGAVASLEATPFAARVLVACKSLILYLWELIAPVNLLPLYPYPKQVGILMPEFFVPLALVAGITTVCIKVAGKWPSLLTVWVYFVVTLLPVLGLIQSGPQSMADRFSYLPSLGIFLLPGAGAAWLWTRATANQIARYATVGMTAVLVLTLAGLTLKQIAVWHDSITLWSCTINGQTERFPEPYYLRGIAYGDTGDFVSAISDYTTAVTIEPAYGPAYINRGVAFLERGEIDRAIEDFNTAISLKVNPPDSYTNRGNAFYKKGELNRAIEDYTVAISLEPSLFQAYLNRGNVYKVKGELEPALADYTKALSLNPSYAKGYIVRGDIYLKNGSVELAVKDYQMGCSLGNEVGCSKALFPFPLK
jgi:protein O-mannosyl-transferase